MASSRVRPLVDGDAEAIGPYRVLGRLGAGGMGIVYAAMDAQGLRVAVKVVRAEIAGDPSFRARFRREVDLLRRVTGPCLVPLLAADTSAARPWLATEYVPGPTLQDHLVRYGPLAGGTLTALAAGVASALERVHSAGVVHRDLKPNNVILAPGGPRVLDFGIAHVLDETSITRTGTWTGTPGWTSPEEYRGERPGTAADVFAWGALVAYAATGRLPFGSGSPDAVAYRIMSLAADIEGVPATLRPLVELALDKEPARRPTASELVEHCTALLAAEPVPALHGPPARPLGGGTLDAAIADHWSVIAEPDPSWHTLAREAREERPGTRARPRQSRSRSRLLLATAAAVTLLVGGGLGYTLIDHQAEAAQRGQAVPPAGAGQVRPGTPALPPGNGGGQATGAVPTVSGSFGSKAAITLPGGLPATRFSVSTLSQGNGAPVKRQDWVTVNYSAANWTTGKTITSSYDPGERPEVFQVGAGKVISALERSVAGRRVGSRLLVVAPPSDAFGDKGSQALGVGPGATLVFVVDIMSAVHPDSAVSGTMVQGQGGTDPQVSGTGSTIPTITIPAGATPPAGLRRQVLIQGDGDPVRSGQTVVVQYRGVLFDNGQVFDSSYEHGGAVSFRLGTGSVIKGWDEGLVGQRVGSRVLLVVPPALGFGDKGQGSVPGGATLVYVIDILGAA